MAPRTSIAAAISTLAALGMLAGCSADEPTGRAASSTTTTTTASTPTADYIIMDGQQRFGPGRWGLPADGDPAGPVAVFDVPDEFEGREGFIWASVDTFANITFSAPARVFIDPCSNPKTPPSARVRDALSFATALSELRVGTTTKPGRTPLAGRTAYFVERTLPPADFQKCKGSAEGIPLWETAVAGTGRSMEVPGTERYWIVDVDGRVLVITTMAEDGTARETADQLRQVVQTVSFVART